VAHPERNSAEAHEGHGVFTGKVIPLFVGSLALLVGGAALAQATPASSATRSSATQPRTHVPPAYPLATSGNRILDANGAVVVWQGVNWFGFDTGDQVPHGLWSRDYRDMLQQITDLGFNTIRMPFSLQMLAGTTTGYIEYGGGKNAELKGKTPLEIMDIIVDEAGREGLMVILDNHSQSNDGYTYDLWYGQGGYTEDDWIAAWEMLAARYADTPQVVAFDLKNEPHGVATWGDGASTDWRRAAERAGNAVLGVAPDKLIVVEGIEGPVAGGQVLTKNWWGGNLEGVHNNPVRLDVPNRLVYSLHEYGPEVFMQDWFKEDPADMAESLAERWAAGFGYIHDEEIAPVYVGEFGAKQVDPSTTEGRWITQFADYLADTGISWTFWSWNPDSGDTGGVLTDDWTTVHEDKMALLTELMDGVRSSTPIVLKARVVRVASWKSGSCYLVNVRNVSTQPTKSWTARLTLPKGAKVTSQWNGKATVKGRVVTIAAPVWGGVISEGGSVQHGGLCISGKGKPTKVSATALAHR